MVLQSLSPNDPSSYSRPESAVVTHIAINLSVDFDRKILRGSVDLDVTIVGKGVEQIVLDTNNLNISKIVDKESNEILTYDVAGPVEEFGSKLSINLPNLAACSKCVLTIFYETNPNASGLQWLTPQQTAGKKHPFLFSQFQPIHARSFIPCQDTPAVKTKYTANITGPEELTVLMSALRKSTELVNGKKQSSFVQNVPVPAYLIAIAVGALESRKLGPRSHVWAEKEIVEACAYEFANTEHQLKTAEDICGPYVWGVYDLLVLPPSFAFGGMENPCLTFVTPTLLAGDRSLANVVAHEIAHSWTGNLLTNRNFEHFWLNEGFTMFVERKIVGRLASSLEQDFDASQGLLELTETIKRLGEENPLTRLVVDLNGVHPDDAFSVVPYEKGHTFLRYIESVVGGPAQFEPFLKSYFDAFKYKSIDTNDFKAYFEKYFEANEAIASIDWKSWLYSPGMPIIIPEYNKSLAEKCDEIVEQFLQWDETGSSEFPLQVDDVKSLSAEQQIYLLEKLSQAGPFSIEKLQRLDGVFQFSKSNNAEIKFRWLRTGLKAHWIDVVKPTLLWITEVGRMKYVRPLYRDLYAWEEVRAQAIQNFEAHKAQMMHVVSYTVAKDLHLIC